MGRWTRFVCCITHMISGVINIQKVFQFLAFLISFFFIWRSESTSWNISTVTFCVWCLFPRVFAHYERIQLEFCSSFFLLTNNFVIYALFFFLFPTFFSFHVIWFCIVCVCKYFQIKTCRRIMRYLYPLIQNH